MHTASEVTLPVTLEHDFKRGDDNNMLVINGGNHCIEFDEIVPGADGSGIVWHTITLQLAGNASSGEFCPVGHPVYPGFTWLVRNPHNIMLLQPVRTKLVLHNHHHGRETRGRWYYQIFARFEDKIYGVPLTFAAGAGNTNNPSIKNR